MDSQGLGFRKSLPLIRHIESNTLLTQDKKCIRDPGSKTPCKWISITEIYKEYPRTANLSKYGDVRFGIGAFRSMESECTGSVYQRLVVQRFGVKCSESKIIYLHPVTLRLPLICGSSPFHLQAAFFRYRHQFFVLKTLVSHLNKPVDCSVFFNKQYTNRRTVPSFFLTGSTYAITSRIQITSFSNTSIAKIKSPI